LPVRVLRFPRPGLGVEPEREPKDKQSSKSDSSQSSFWLDPAVKGLCNNASLRTCRLMILGLYPPPQGVRARIPFSEGQGGAEPGSLEPIAGGRVSRSWVRQPVWGGT
jgi:hypothetical protein